MKRKRNGRRWKVRKEKALDKKEKGRERKDRAKLVFSEGIPGFE